MNEVNTSTRQDSKGCFAVDKATFATYSSSDLPSDVCQLVDGAFLCRGRVCLCLEDGRTTGVAASVENILCVLYVSPSSDKGSTMSKLLAEMIRLSQKEGARLEWPVNAIDTERDKLEEVARGLSMTKGSFCHYRTYTFDESSTRALKNAYRLSYRWVMRALERMEIVPFSALSPEAKDSLHEKCLHGVFPSTFDVTPSFSSFSQDASFAIVCNDKVVSFLATVQKGSTCIVKFLAADETEAPKGTCLILFERLLEKTEFKRMKICVLEGNASMMKILTRYVDPHFSFQERVTLNYVSQKGACAHEALI